MIVWLASYPRSGNTLFRMLLNTACAVKTFSVYDDPLFDQLGAADAVGHEKLVRRLDELVSSPGVHFVKTHDRPIDRQPAIYLVRDGRDALVSYAHFLLDFGGDRRSVASTTDGRRSPGVSEVLRELIEGRGQFGSWSEHVESWMTRSEPKPFSVHFEQLLQEPRLWLTRALQSCGAAVSVADDLELPAFAELHEKWPQFFRRGAAATWRDDMSDDLHELFWHHHGQVMEMCGYSKSKP